MNISKEEPILIGKLDMNLDIFYDGIYLNNKYQLADIFKGIINKYPPTTNKIEYSNINNEIIYQIKDVDVLIYEKDLNIVTNKIWNNVKDVIKVDNLEDLLKIDIYKVKILNKDGIFSKRILLDQVLEDRQKDLSNEIYLGKEFYRFVSYTYAAYIETKNETVKSYQEFQEYYGKYVYGMTVEVNNQLLGLTWLDYISHKPDAHLEFGITSNLSHYRFNKFNNWQKNDEIIITIMADGFKDIVLKSKLKKKPANRWANFWYHNMIKRRNKNV